MANSNILLFDQLMQNMLSDQEYSTSQQRQNGVQAGIASSKLHNKFSYQVSLMAYAIAQLMLANGLDAMDSDQAATFVSNLSSSIVQKVADKASQEQAEAGTDDTKWVSPLNVFQAIQAKLSSIFQVVNTGWKEIQRYDVNGSYQWEAPDLLGNGQSYIIGAMIIGAGGSGAAAAYLVSSANWDVSATGGASGFARSTTIQVTPGTKYNVVVGKGGVARTVSVTSEGSSSVSDRQDGANGGSTSFNGISAAGGQGGTCSTNYANTDGAYGGQSVSQADYSTKGLAGGMPVPAIGNDEQDAFANFFLYMMSATASGTDCFNPFTCERILSAGSSAYAKRDQTDSGTVSSVALNGYQGGSGVGDSRETSSSFTATSSSPTGAGSGGGAAAVRVQASNYTSTATAKSSAGNDGAVIIYAMGDNQNE